MHATILEINLLGNFEFRYGDQVVDDTQNRSRKLWTLAGLLCLHHREKLSLSELYSHLWEDAEETTNPANAMKALFHRLRLLLSPFGEDISRSLFISKKGYFYLNPNIPCRLDIEVFEETIIKARETTTPEEKLSMLQQAAFLYRNSFLKNYQEEYWIQAVAEHYSNLFTECIHTLIPLMEEKAMLSELITVLNHALSVDFGNEEYYYHLMKAQLALNLPKDTVATYQNAKNYFVQTNGSAPPAKLNELYQQAFLRLNTGLLDLTRLMEQIEDAGKAPGALYCDYDFFLRVYHALSRGLNRNGSVLHLALLTIAPQKDTPLSKRSLDICVQNLRELLTNTLRHGDVISMCTASQFILLLPNANYENAVLVTDRITRRFARQYPHSPAKLTFDITTVEPR
ncbi:MAG: hypothetical protein E7222_12985 [Clostridiales bacterium]|jgi:DNA-binding SARP family transcriptional activator|nr:hypothetical protein [Clostridiales bacterium]